MSDTTNAEDVCRDCGARVADRAVHDRFHSILNGHATAIAVLVNTHASAPRHDRYDVRERIAKRPFDNWSADALAEVTAQIDAGCGDE